MENYASGYDRKHMHLLPQSFTSMPTLKAVQQPVYGITTKTARGVSRKFFNDYWRDQHEKCHAEFKFIAICHDVAGFDAGTNECTREKILKNIDTFAFMPLSFKRKWVRKVRDKKKFFIMYSHTYSNYTQKNLLMEFFTLPRSGL